MPALPDPAVLSELVLFRDLEPEQLSWLNDHLHLKTFPAGSNIVAAEQPGEVVYIVLEGTIKISIEQVDGTEVILAILGPGDTVGELSLIDSAGRSANVVTMERSSLVWMDRDTFWESLQKMPAITYELLHVLGDRLRLANEQIQALATLDIYGRVARQILAIAARYGQVTADGEIVIPIRLTQGDIASLVGASRERVNQVMVTYKQQNYISIDQNYRIIIHDRQALVQRCR
jgi:CRP/FNR family cyclic AMP-dependent transcriptional regulator